MKYIDAEKLYKQVDSLMARYTEYEKEFKVDDEELSIFYQGKRKMCSDLLGIIDSLQQEQPVDGLEEEIIRYLRDECSSDDEPSVSEIARHFAEWGEKNAYKAIMKKADEVRSKMYDVDYDIKIRQIESIKEYKEPLIWKDIEDYLIEISSSEGVEHLKR